MAKELSKHNKIVISLLALSVAIIIVGIMFLLNAMQENPEDGFFPAFCNISNLLGKYIIVIVTMATGIMMSKQIQTLMVQRFLIKTKRNFLLRMRNLKN